MYFHHRKLEYVTYGRVHGVDDENLTDAYSWLGEHCGYNPQVWLSRSTSAITGKFNREGILFGFENINGFAVDYGQWETVLFAFTSTIRKKETNEKTMQAFFNNSNNEDDAENLEGNDRIFPTYDYEEWKQHYLFREHDQVVVPSLQLKAAKQIYCKNEKEKRQLRKMGFIEDRIEIKKFFRK